MFGTLRSLTQNTSTRTCPDNDICDHLYRRYVKVAIRMLMSHGRKWANWLTTHTSILSSGYRNSALFTRVLNAETYKKKKQYFDPTT